MDSFTFGVSSIDHKLQHSEFAIYESSKEEKSTLQNHYFFIINSLDTHVATKVSIKSKTGVSLEQCEYFVMYLIEVQVQSISALIKVILLSSKRYG